jgi:2-dehydro-3-deoxy-D-arabinonate dehydratase
MRGLRNRNLEAVEASTIGCTTPERPELFFKATANWLAGHRGKVAIRRDATWSVPEPEVTLLLSPSGKILGYTIGNDMSSRDIEGENPLYLPQAKVYDRGCALGPGIVVSSEPLPLASERRFSAAGRHALQVPRRSAR